MKPPEGRKWGRAEVRDQWTVATLLMVGAADVEGRTMLHHAVLRVSSVK